MVAYEKFHDGQMSDYIPTDADLQKGFDGIPRQRDLNRYYNYYIIKEKRAPDPGNTLLLFCAPSSANRKPPAYLYVGGFLWARVDYASRAAKNSPPGCFCPFFCDGAAAVRIRPHENSNLLQTENRQRISTLAVFLWARVDYASRAAKNSPPGCFCAVFCDSAAAVRIRPPGEFCLTAKQKPQRTCIR